MAQIDVRADSQASGGRPRYGRLNLSCAFEGVNTEPAREMRCRQPVAPRRAVLIELNPAYGKQIERRTVDRPLGLVSA